MTKQPEKILEKIISQIKNNTYNMPTFISDEQILNKIHIVTKCLNNRSGVRLLMATSLAKIAQPDIDIRKPYTEINGEGTYSGRHFDENYITPFINKYELPCNDTTAFLTPAFRNINQTLTLDMELVGRPREMYKAVIELLNDVQTGKITAESLLSQVIYDLIKIKNENQQRLKSLLDNLENAGGIPLSSEQILTLIKQHLQCKGSSRLPVLVVAAAYKAAEQQLGEQIMPLESHNAADEQTGCLGDIEITLINDDKIVTSYEMKQKRVTRDDLERALHKILNQNMHINNYIFITTEPIDPEVEEYSKYLYELTKGIEFAILDCLGFLKHFLHLFHRIRINYLNEYQTLLLAEPASAVSQELKEAFLSLRQVAETNSF